MRIPTWRLALTGGAIVVLLAVGIGLVAASTGATRSSNDAAQAAGTAAPDASTKPDRRDGAGLRGFLAGRAARLGLGKHLVHVVGTFTDKDGNLITIQIDHGTIQSIGSGSLTVAEAGGATYTVSTNTDTKVWLGREVGALGDLKVGDTIFVQSRVDGGTTLAKRVLKVPAS